MQRNIGLALSGGGIKGAAHIGMLKAFEENNIKIDYISGTSSGSIVACLYACGYKPDEMLILFKKYASYITTYNGSIILQSAKSIIVNRKLPYGFIKGEKIENLINKVCAKKKIYNINQIKMPIAIPAVNIIDGTLVTFISKEVQRAYVDEREKYISDINIGKAVRASSSYPVIFDMCDFLDYKLIDGGVRENIPVEVLYTMGAKKTIVSTFTNKKTNIIPDDLFEVLNSSIDIMGFQIRKEELKKASYILDICIENTKLLDITKIDLCYNIGYKTALERIKEIKKML